MIFKARLRSSVSSRRSIRTKLRLGSDLVTNISILPLAWHFAVRGYTKTQLGVIAFLATCCFSATVGMMLHRNTLRHWRLNRSNPACIDCSAKLIFMPESFGKQKQNFVGSCSLIRELSWHGLA